MFVSFYSHSSALLILVSVIGFCNSLQLLIKGKCAVQLATTMCVVCIQFPGHTCKLSFCARTLGSSGYISQGRTEII